MQANSTAIYTIGYEGAELSAFVRSLVERGVDVLIDVRELPLSRRRGFSKAPLSAMLAAEGIIYFHIRALGAPKPIRDRLRKTGDYESYFERFSAYLHTQRGVLERLAKGFAGTAVALMCFEKDPAECHRSVVARELGKIAAVKPVHLAVEEGEHDGRVREAARLRTRQGATAA